MAQKRENYHLPMKTQTRGSFKINKHTGIVKFYKMQDTRNAELSRKIICLER
jgi:hypothetical protein